MLGAREGMAKKGGEDMGDAVGRAESHLAYRIVNRKYSVRRYNSGGILDIVKHNHANIFRTA